jgi:hypothetical protein
MVAQFLTNVTCLKSRDCLHTELASPIFTAMYNRTFQILIKFVLHRTVWCETYSQSVVRCLSWWLLNYFEESVPIMGLPHLLE